MTPTTPPVTVPAEAVETGLAYVPFGASEDEARSILWAAINLGRELSQPQPGTDAKEAEATK